MPFALRTVEPSVISGTVCDGDDVISNRSAGDPARASNASLTHTLRQMASLTRLAEDVFGDLHAQAADFYRRCTNLQARTDRASVAVSALEKMGDGSIPPPRPSPIPPHSGAEGVVGKGRAFKSQIILEQQVVGKETMPPELRKLYESCDGPPPLSKLNKYRDDGKDALKFYTDAEYFFDFWKKGMLNGTELAPRPKVKKVLPSPVNISQHPSQQLGTALDSSHIQPYPSDPNMHGINGTRLHSPRYATTSHVAEYGTLKMTPFFSSSSSHQHHGRNPSSSHSITTPTHFDTSPAGTRSPYSPNCTAAVQGGWYAQPQGIDRDRYGRRPYQPYQQVCAGQGQSLYDVLPQHSHQNGGGTGQRVYSTTGPDQRRDYVHVMGMYDTYSASASTNGPSNDQLFLANASSSSQYDHYLANGGLQLMRDLTISSNASLSLSSPPHTVGSPAANNPTLRRTQQPPRPFFTSHPNRPRFAPLVASEFRVGHHRYPSAHHPPPPSATLNYQLTPLVSPSAFPPSPTNMLPPPPSAPASPSSSGHTTPQRSRPSAPPPLPPPPSAPTGINHRDEEGTCSPLPPPPPPLPPFLSKCTSDSRDNYLPPPPPPLTAHVITPSNHNDISTIGYLNESVEGADASIVPKRVELVSNKGNNLGSMNNEHRDHLLSAIRTGVPLKKVNSSLAVSASSTTAAPLTNGHIPEQINGIGPQSGIKGGKHLKTALNTSRHCHTKLTGNGDISKPPTNYMAGPGGNLLTVATLPTDVASILARRIAVEYSDTEDTEGSSGEWIEHA